MKEAEEKRRNEQIEKGGFAPPNADGSVAVAAGALGSLAQVKEKLRKLQVHATGRVFLSSPTISLSTNDNPGNFVGGCLGGTKGLGLNHFNDWTGTDFV